MWTVLSSCGTSLLTNGTEENLRKLIIRKSNEKTENNIQTGELAQIRLRIEEVSDFLENASQENISKASAELNAIIKLYSERDRQWGNSQDFHWLVCTDTWLGETTALMVKKWLESQGFSAQVCRQTDLQTQTINEFQLSLSDLTKWCYENLPSPQQTHSRIIFNLTGGFKSVNGFLQTLGMFRADEIVYIFEGEKKLLSIPRLPVSLASESLIRENLRDFRRLSLGLKIENNSHIPETLLLRIDDQIALSAWGEIQWNEYKRKIYSEAVQSVPDEKVRFSDSVESEMKKHSNKFYEMNEQIDRLVKYFDSNQKLHTHNLGFEEVKKSKGVYEFKAWDDGQGFRFFGHFESKVFIVDSLERGLH